MMNWKIWAWPRQLRAAETEAAYQRTCATNWASRWNEASYGREKLVADGNILRAQLGMKEGLAKSPALEPQIHAALVLVDDATPLWRAVHAILDQTQAVELDDAVKPGCTNEERQYHAGRVAMLEDLRASLLQRWAAARQQNHEAGQP